MKILIVSDIHGNYNNMKKVLQNDSSFDYLFLLGDLLSGPDITGYDPEKLADLLNKYKDKIIAVKGNCDYDNSSLEFNTDMYYITLFIDDIFFLITHGHYYNRYNLPPGDFDVLLNGHTHVPILERENNRIFLNPGSITIPRRGDKKTYIIYEDDVFYLKDVEKNRVIQKISI